MTEDQYDQIARVIRTEERDHILGIIEWYIGILGDTKEERTVKHILTHVIAVIERNDRP